MAVRWKTEVVARAAAEEFAAAWGRRLNGQPTLEPAQAPSGAGWLLTFLVKGEATGRIELWIDRESATASTRLSLAIETDPGEEAVLEFLKSFGPEVLSGMEARPSLAGLSAEFATVVPDEAPVGIAFSLGRPNGGTGALVTAVDIQPPAATQPTPDSRFEAVLDVDLPLIVRFGRAVMPMRALADLGPGSVIDMGRSPDEPVELLVGQRVIARGEVVIVAGHYGVRITELAARQMNEGEARTT